VSEATWGKDRGVRRLFRHVSPLGWAIIVTAVAAVALEPVAKYVAIGIAAVAALLVLTAVADALGDAETHGIDSAPAKRDLFRAREGEARRRAALRRWAGDRDWDRKAPDAPDEPPDLIWERERERRAAERKPL
jgi:hypothetical protein